MVALNTLASRGTEATLFFAMAAAIEARRRVVRSPRPRRVRQPLKVLLAGYNGARNTGADVRVHEIVRQLDTIFGRDLLEPTVLSADLRRTEGYFERAPQLQLQRVFPPFLYREVPRFDGVLACEGSMFKSKFANAQSLMMAGALGLALAEGKLAVAYGSEAGAMDASLRRFVQRYVAEALIMARTRASVERLEGLGLRSFEGTDTAWTFQPDPPAAARRLLEHAGWDGKRPLVVLCPVNPFWWPVQPDLSRALALPLSAAARAAHYASVYFHRAGQEVDQAQARYLDALAEAARALRERHDAFVVTVGMEALDRRACERLSARLGAGTPSFVADDHPMAAIVGLLRQAALLVSSRYHAIVTSMPAGVPALGVTMDERIANLMRERGESELLLGVDDDDLAARLLEKGDLLLRDPAPTRRCMARSVAANLRRMAGMGRRFWQQVYITYPEVAEGAKVQGDAPEEAFLPRLEPLLETHLASHSHAA